MKISNVFTMDKDKNDSKKESGKKVKGRREKIGIVVSDRMDKTVVVRVDRLKVHKKYKKRYRVSKKYKAHDEENRFKVGDKVMIVECRPISKEKRWIAKEIQMSSNKQEK